MGNIDSIPVVSQAKSLVQVVSGDDNGAKRTQENFLRTGPIASQAYSAYLSINVGIDTTSLNIKVPKLVSCSRVIMMRPEKYRKSLEKRCKC